MARAGLWSALAFVLNPTWEIAHVKLYTIWAAADGMSVAWELLHCSRGDVVNALALFALMQEHMQTNLILRLIKNRYEAQFQNYTGLGVTLERVTFLFIRFEK